MPRVKRSVHAPQEAAQGPRQAKGYWGLKKFELHYMPRSRSSARWAYAYRDRKVRKREFRKLWIMRINAGARAHGLSYNQFMHGRKAPVNTPASTIKTAATANSNGLPTSRGHG